MIIEAAGELLILFNGGENFEAIAFDNCGGERELRSGPPTPEDGFWLDGSQIWLKYG